MAQFEQFAFQTLQELRDKIDALGVNMPTTEDFSPLAQPVRVGSKEAPNAMAVMPMEGCDSNPDGSPSDLVQRRYTRFAGGGAGLLWIEACAVVEEGKANPLQMMLTRENLPQFQALGKLILDTARNAHGFRPVTVLQLTHSGRYSRPIDKAAPMIAQRDPLLDPRVGVQDDSAIVTDEYLEELQQRYVDSALLAREAGFDGVDVKACHRYLVSELLAAHTRGGRFGGTLENRMRFLLDTVRKIRSAVGNDFIVASRFNVYDAHPYPYGFGVGKEDLRELATEEPIQLVRELVSAGADLLSNSTGNPYFRNPHVTRPFDKPAVGGETPDEHPLESAARLMHLSEQVKHAAGSVPVVGSGYSWLRQFIPHVGAANVERGRVSFVGLGRESFAYPDAPSDILNKGEMDPRKACTACSMCTQLMRDHSRTGCVVRDAAVYAPMYREARTRATAG